jgi:hypothetical protein
MEMTMTTTCLSTVITCFRVGGDVTFAKVLLFWLRRHFESSPAPRQCVSCLFIPLADSGPALNCDKAPHLTRPLASENILNRATAVFTKDVDARQALMTKVSSCDSNMKKKRQKQTCQGRGGRDELQATGGNESTRLDST